MNPNAAKKKRLSSSVLAQKSMLINPLTAPQDIIAAKMADLQSRLKVVSTESVAMGESIGRVLAQHIHAFRDNPAIDVSAMDGYAIRLDDHDGRAFPVCGTATAGSAQNHLADRSAVRVFTGGPVPTQAQCVVRREDCNESETYVSICVPKESLVPGQNIRRRGENARAGDTMIAAGSLLTPCRFAGAVTFSDQSSQTIFRKVRIGIINTGDELIEFGQPIEPWQIRDSNGPFLESILARLPWVEATRTKVVDDQDATRQAIRHYLESCDVLLMTGGVSMGDTDYVPDAIKSAGCQVVFHRIPIRPGRPMLGAVGPRGQLVLGLPGNPLSVAVTFRRFGWELLRSVAGLTQPEHPPALHLDCDDTKTLDLIWFRLVCLKPDGRLSLVPSQGSGDIASLIQSDGFVEIPVNAQSAGCRPFYAW